MEKAFPKCLKCEDGVLLPLSDYGREGAPIMYKAWVCSNPDCGFSIRIDNGEVTFSRVTEYSTKSR
ncbi:hypothetical protein J7M00_06040 [bacterium]|nr:hypothetical protein [bacterium]